MDKYVDNFPPKIYQKIKQNYLRWLTQGLNKPKYLNKNTYQCRIKKV